MPYPPGFRYEDVPGDQYSDRWSDEVYENLEPAVAEILQSRTFIGGWIKKKLQSIFEETSTVECPEATANELNEAYHRCSIMEHMNEKALLEISLGTAIGKNLSSRLNGLAYCSDHVAEAESLNKLYEEMKND